ncbi:hypothetical protein HanXRQr2_Chr16g0750981 [Helianthus annuus]|uniref:Uncharacterized protein n=1 Tax=Helianthus annuus TaxID=4232 RepID=A0A9K3DRS6_HELAN|nr:hypothetical protein HanXRQr2_Chr16g0750981 [Helianthus annuus]KAJ0821394.1 hypothetical protein HanPSC8_Chr16g0719671 [Helianthus annuus]
MWVPDLYRYVHRLLVSHDLDQPTPMKVKVKSKSCRVTLVDFYEVRVLLSLPSTHRHLRE